MKPSCIEYGTRYSDDSGWGRHVEMDARTSMVSCDISGGRFAMSFDEAFWLVEALLRGREALGMDKFTMSGPSEPGAEK